MRGIAEPGAESGTEPPPTNPPPVDPTAGFPITPFTAADGTRFGVQTLVTGLQIPWSLAFTPDGRLLVSERPGRVRVYQNGALLPEPALTLTDVFTRDESGILGLAVHPDFANNHFVYLVYTANGPRGAIARLMRFRELDNRLAEGVVLLDEVPANNIHNGSRVKFGPDRLLYVTFGDVARPRWPRMPRRSTARSCASTTTAPAPPAIASARRSTPSAIATRRASTGIRSRATSGKLSTARPTTTRST